MKYKKEWTFEELVFLIQNYQTKPIKLIANQMGLSTSLIYSKAYRIGLSKRNKS